MNKHNIDISFIILTWNSHRFLDRCFSSIISCCTEQKLNFEILVSDNGSTDQSTDIFDRFSKEYPDQFKVEYLGKNTGTTYPRNLGLRKAAGEFICILDSDTELREGSLVDVLEILKSDDGVGLAVPRLLLPDGTIQNSVKRFPTFIQKLGKIRQAVFKMKAANSDFYPDFPFKTVTEVDTAISACWFFRRELVETIGYLDENIFYSPEDLDFCVRVRKAGFKILYCPHFTVFHDTQQISHRKPFSKVSRSHFGGLIYYFKKHGGWISNRHLYR